MYPGRGWGLFLSPKTAILDLVGLGPLISDSRCSRDMVEGARGVLGLLGDLPREEVGVIGLPFGGGAGNIF